MRSWIALLLVLTSLAGCTGGESGPEPDPEAVDTDEKETGTGAVASLSFEANIASGEIPLEVVFAASVKEGSAAYKGGLTWTFTAGDDSDAVTGDQDDFFSVVHTYEQVGNFSASLEVQLADETLLDAELSIDAAEGPKIPDRVVVIEHEGFGLLPLPVYDEVVVKDLYDGGANGTFVVGYNVPIETGAKRATFIVDQNDGPASLAADMDLFLYGPDGAHVTDSGSGYPETIEVTNPGPGTWLPVVLNFAGTHEAVTGSFSLTIEIVYPGVAE